MSQKIFDAIHSTKQAVAEAHDAVQQAVTRWHKANEAARDGKVKWETEEGWKPLPIDKGYQRQRRLDIRYDELCDTSAEDWAGEGTLAGVLLVARDNAWDNPDEDSMRELLAAKDAWLEGITETRDAAHELHKTVASLKSVEDEAAELKRNL